jgi:hypothetical protein
MGAACETSFGQTPEKGKPTQELWLSDGENA